MRAGRFKLRQSLVNEQYHLGAEEIDMVSRSSNDYSYDVMLEGSPLCPFVRNLPPNSGILGARALTGDLVCDAEGEYVGEVVDVIVDTRIGCVVWAVIAVGGFLGVGRRRLAVPWNVVTPDARYKLCSLSIGQDQLMGMPRFSA
jgi:sporulation protein YlmC with PRC-barrel domain